MNIHSRKLWDIIGAAVGAIAIIAGICLFFTAPMSFRTDSSDGFASFGADFYTYIYSAADAAASNTAVTANNLREMGATQAKQVGTCLILLGALVIVHYGKSYFCTPDPAKEPNAPRPAEVLPPHPPKNAPELSAATGLSLGDTSDDLPKNAVEEGAE